MKEQLQRRLERLRLKGARRKAKSKSIRIDKQKAKEADNKARRELMRRIKKEMT
jgi:hypothetical protein